MHPPDQREHWDQRYREGNTPWETGQPSSFLQQTIAAERIAPCRALDLGCGSGIHSVWLAQQGFEVTGLDLSPLAIDLARQRAAAAGVRVEFLARDLLAPGSLGTTYEFFLDRGCYHIVRKLDRTAYLRNVANWTAPGALGLVLTGNAREPQSPGPPVVTEEEFRAEWSGAFDVLWLREGRFDPGPRDTGPPPLAWAGLLRRRPN
ncbi:MAG: class I SAM-dependent methyltransferase [Planctomycetia bacterium]|nr:class I SAM-dependent methyltransferase [Planctomycetia bacterium]